MHAVLQGAVSGNLPVVWLAHRLNRLTATAPTSTAPSCLTHWFWRMLLDRRYATILWIISGASHRPMRSGERGPSEKQMHRNSYNAVISLRLPTWCALYDFHECRSTDSGNAERFA